MNHDWLITFRSITFAQKAERLLKRENISCIMQRTPRELSQRGCGYCLRIRAWEAMTAAQLLQDNAITYGKIYAITDGGRPEERIV